MKALTILFFLFPPFLIFTHAQGILTPFVVANYNFNGNAEDSSDNGFNGIVHGGATLTTNQIEQENMAYQFDGIDDYIEVPNELDFGIEDFSVELWFNTNSFLPIPPAARPISKGVTVYGSPSYAGYALQIHELDGVQELRFLLGDASGERTITISSDVPKSEWLHVVAMREGSKIRVYLNADLSAEESTVFVYNVDTNIPFTIGTQLRNTQSTLSFFDGKIGICRLYNRALIPREVSYLYYLDNGLVKSIKGEELLPIEVYPTLINTDFNIVFPGENVGQKTELTVFNQQGQLIYSAIKEVGTKIENVNCNNWQSGFYLLKIKQSNAIYQTKLVKIGGY